jgi:H+/Cl- antiporter ClcA
VSQPALSNGISELERELGITVIKRNRVFLKLLSTTASLRVGAEGGLLTPGLTIGALLGLVFGRVWSVWWPGASSGGFALVGAAAFLAVSMQMPLTAVVLVFEFTRADHDFLVPVLLAVAGAMAAAELCSGGIARRLSKP